MEPYFAYNISSKNPKFYYCVDKANHDEPKELNFTELLKLFNKNYRECTVGIGTTNTIDNNIRKSKILDNITICLANNNGYHHSGGDYFSQTFRFENAIRLIIPKNFRNIRYFLEPFNGVTRESNNWDMLVYEKGDFFACHTDGKENDLHLATILLLPPKSINNYKGGELIVYDGNNNKIITAHETDWTVIGLPINIGHESKPVIEGKKIIFKTKFQINKEDFEFYKDTQYKFNLDELPEHSKEDDNENKKKLENTLEKIIFFP